MLTQLSIKQFTVVEALDVDFAPGLTVLTGETGAGKSIMLDALGLCLGDRADASTVRPGAERAEICASFDISRLKAAQGWLQQRDLDADGECIFRRVLTREGRSRAYINGRPATVQDCAALGELLIDIHSQHAHQSLLRRASQRELLDSFAGQSENAATVKVLAGQWRELHARLNALRGAQQEQADREQLLRYQVQELDELALGDKELEKLEGEQRILENADSIQQQAGSAIDLCEEHESGVRAALAQLDPSLHQGKAMDNVREMLGSAAIQIEEARGELQQYLSGCDNDPRRLEDVATRLEAIYSLARKHRVMPEALPGFHRELSGELAELDSSDERLDALRDEADQALQAYRKAAATLSTARSKAARKLEKQVAALLGKLSMGNCAFSVSLAAHDSEDPHPHGQEEPELLISTHPGAPLQSLARVASGGELSRISLAIQVATAGANPVPSMIFDEVDVGIGGAVAEVVGRLLADMSKDSQVLCVTHLPQVAAQGRNHLQVKKLGKGKKLSSTLATLSPDERVEEIARMLGGVKLTENTRSHAREMLEGT